MRFVLKQGIIQVFGSPQIPGRFQNKLFTLYFEAKSCVVPDSLNTLAHTPSEVGSFVGVLLLQEFGYLNYSMEYRDVSQFIEGMQSFNLSDLDLDLDWIYYWSMTTIEVMRGTNKYQ